MATDRLDGALSSLAIKAPVRTSTTANITLSALQTIDGIALLAKDRVLVKNQTTGSENGIYEAATSTWTRAPDFDGASDVVDGTLVPITGGTLNARTMWEVTTANPITIGTTALTFAQRPDLSAQLITMAQLQNSSTTLINGVAGTNTITGTLTPALAAYTSGQSFMLVPLNTNTAATTLNINSLGAQNVFASNVACAGGELKTGVPTIVEYDGTRFNIIGQANMTNIAATDSAVDKVHVYDSSAAKDYAVPIGSFLRKNAIIGGDFSTNPWQRGTSFAAIVTGAYSADRWAYSATGAMVHTISQSADAPTVAQAGRLTNHCLLVDCTTADASLAAGDLTVVRQKIEGYNFLPLAQKAMTCSFWHKHTKTGTYCVAFRNSGSDRSYVAEYTQAVTDTWELATITNITASPSAGTWDYTNGIGLDVIFVLAAGSNFNAAVVNTWNSLDDFATTNQVNATDSTANNFRIALVQLEAGSVATEFDPRTVQEELALCQRYYQKTFRIGTAPAQNVGIDTGELNFVALAATTNSGARWLFETRMRTAPTVTTYNPAAANAQVRNRAIGDDCTGTTSYNLDETGVSVFATTSAGSAAGNNLALHMIAGAEL